MWQNNELILWTPKGTNVTPQCAMSIKVTNQIKIIKYFKLGTVLLTKIARSIWFETNPRKETVMALHHIKILRTGNTCDLDL